MTLKSESDTFFDKSSFFQFSRKISFYGLWPFAMRSWECRMGHIFMPPMFEFMYRRGLCRNADVVLCHCIERRPSFSCQWGMIFKRSGHMSNLADQWIWIHSFNLSVHTISSVRENWRRKKLWKSIYQRGQGFKLGFSMQNNELTLYFSFKHWQSWMEMYWALWKHYSSFEAKKALSSSSVT